MAMRWGLPTCLRKSVLVKRRASGKDQSPGSFFQSYGGREWPSCSVDALDRSARVTENNKEAKKVYVMCDCLYSFLTLKLCCVAGSRGSVAQFGRAPGF